MKILIVDDDNTINQLLKDILKPKYAITQAYSGTEAIRLLEQKSFDCILLDCMLPGLTGREVITKARALTQCPIIILSALTDINNRVELLKQGADDYITKPFDNREVIARVEVQLRKQGNHNDDGSFSVKNIHYDARSCSLTCNGEPLTLTLKEQELLLMMLKQPNRVFTKAILYETIWHDAYYGDDNTLAVHISRLRKELQKHQANIEIETIWALGYKVSI